MTRLPRATGKEYLAAFLRAGWEPVRVRGSHHYVRKGGRTVCIPVHTGEILSPRVVTSMAAQAGLTTDDLGDLLRR